MVNMKIGLLIYFHLLSIVAEMVLFILHLYSFKYALISEDYCARNGIICILYFCIGNFVTTSKKWGGVCQYIS